MMDWTVSCLYASKQMVSNTVSVREHLRGYRLCTRREVILGEVGHSGQGSVSTLTILAPKVTQD